MIQQDANIRSAHFKLFKNTYLFVALSCFLFSGRTTAQADWVTQLGGLEGDVGIASTADAFGHVFTIGTFSGTSAFGSFNVTSAGSGDVFVIRSNAATGAVEWARQLGGSAEDNGNAIVSDPFGNIYCTGRFSGTVFFGSFSLTATGTSDAFLAKIDPSNGNVLWAKKMGGGGFDTGLALTCDGLGNVFTSGCFQGTGTFGTFTVTPAGPSLNIFITRTDGVSGNSVWAKGFGSAGYATGTALSCDLNGDVYMTGYFEGEAIFGTQTLTAVNYQDVFISKHYASTGNVSWAVCSGGQGNDGGTGIVAGADGFVYTTGKFEKDWIVGTTTLSAEGSADIFLSRRDGLTGAVSWLKKFGSQGYDQPNGMIGDANGHLYITGQFNGYITFGSDELSSAGNADLFIVKVEMSSGNALVSGSSGGQGVDSGNGITTGPNNALYCTGSFQSSANIGGKILNARGTSDSFVMKLNRTTVGIEKEELFPSTIQLMPIPFEKDLQVTWKRDNTSPYQLWITDTNGKKVFDHEDYQNFMTLHLDFLSPGIYCLSILDENGTLLNKKIIKK